MGCNLKKEFNSAKWKPPEELPIVRPQFYTCELLPLPGHVKAFHLMAEMALLHSAFQAGLSESAKRHFAAVPVIGHVMPVGVSSSWLWKYTHKNTKGLCLCVRLHVSVCMFKLKTLVCGIRSEISLFCLTERMKMNGHCLFRLVVNDELHTTAEKKK